MFSIENMEHLEKHKWVLIPFEKNLALNLKAELLNKYNLGLFKTAQVTLNENQQQIRSDSTFWLESEPASLAPQEAEFISLITDIKSKLKDYFRISLTDCECHYAIYEKGQFYKKHIDRTRHNNKRFFSFVVYLNESWQADFGGQFVAYKEDEAFLKVEPQMGQMLLFFSDIEHEVLLSSQTRYSLTGWIRS